MDRYSIPSILDAQIEKLKFFITDGEKHCKKVYKDVAEAHRAFEAIQKYLQ